MTGEDQCAIFWLTLLARPAKPRLARLRISARERKRGPQVEQHSRSNQGLQATRLA